MKGKDILGTISPLYGLATGKGAFGKIGVGGVPGAIAAAQKGKKNAQGSVQKMKCGGKVKKYKSGGKVRGDGVCRVKTKGMMR